LCLNFNKICSVLFNILHNLSCLVTKDNQYVFHSLFFSFDFHKYWNKRKCVYNL
jgi:hypothetical protein